MSDHDHLEETLRTQGFRLVRQKTHRVYKNPEGKTLVTAATPSDWRWSRNALHQLARLCGPIQKDYRPLRARRPHGKLQVDSAAPTPGTFELAPVLSVPVPITQELNRADRVCLKRREKHDRQRQGKIDAQRVRLSEAAQFLHECLLECDLIEDVACEIVEALGHCRWLGFQDCQLAVADVILDSVPGEEPQKMIAFYVRVNRWFVDIFEGVLRETPGWTEKNGNVQVEVWSDLKS